jgi:hypothetical protein
MVQRRAAHYTMNNYHNSSSVNTMIDTLGWPTLAERRLKHFKFDCKVMPRYFADVTDSRMW